MSKQYCKLIMVTGENNNKYYECVYEGGSNFTVNYGRVDSTKTTVSYPYSQWDSLIKSKVKKGYKDVTDLVQVKVTKVKDDDDTGKIDDKLVDKFMTLMKNYTNNLVKATYSVAHTAVSHQQIEKAQELIDELRTMKKATQQAKNDTLIELYTVIPRFMSNVKNHLLPSITFEKTLEQEQDNLDAMASQVNMYNRPKKVKDTSKKTQNLLDILGIKMREATPGKDLDYLMKQMSKNRVSVKGVFEVEKAFEDDRFDSWMKAQKNKSTRTLIHGTKCTSVIPILELGLKIRPPGNFQFSGKIYGEGNYFSEVVQKSLGYTGYDKDKVLLVYEVHTGNPFVYNGWYKGNSFTLNYKELSTRGFDSTHVNAGNGLLNSEIIVYKEQQARIKYIIWLN